MLEVAIAQEGAQTKKGLTKEHSKEGEGDQNFKEVFAKVVTKSSKSDAQQNQKVEKTTEAETKASSLNDKAVNALLNALLSSSKKEGDKPIEQMTLQTKLTSAKNILESKLNQTIDIKDLKDAKTLQQLIVQANKKGLNVTSAKFELAEPTKEERKKDSQSNKANNAQNNTNSQSNKANNAQNNSVAQHNPQQTKIAHSSVLSNILHQQGKTKEIAQKETPITLASLLSKGQTKEAPTLKINPAAAKESEKTDPKEAKGSILQMLLNKEGNEKKSSNSTTASPNGNPNQKDSKDENNAQQRVVEKKISEQKIVETKVQQQVEQTKESWTAKISSALQLERQDAASTKTEVDAKPTALVHQVNVNDKIFDAKATMRHFASSLKEQIQEYKPPISRLTLTLNPKNLGEVDVVIRSRGDSLTVQISSATAPALQILAQNSMELRQNLQNMGFENLSMQFSSGNKEGNGQAFEQNKRFYNDEELEDEELSAMVDQIEIQLPKYV